jgi:hypothetical protein
MRAQVVGPRPVHLQGLHHPVGHPDLDLVEEAHVRRVKRVVEVEDPGGDAGEICFGMGGSSPPRPCWEGLIAGGLWR